MKTITYQDTTVLYTSELWGGGDSFGQEFIGVVKDTLGKVGHICEFGAGPGFIGFSLLAHGLCDRLTLVDINPEAINLCKKTISDNHLEGKVTVHVSDCFDNVPESEKWDLVVSNPPHYPSTIEERYKDIRKYDNDWEVHKKFYMDVGKHLKPKGTILFQEKKLASTVYSFKKMIEESGLTIIGVFHAKHSFFQFMKPVLKLKNPLRCFRQWRTHKFYFIWSGLTADYHDRPPIEFGQLKLWR